MKKKNKSDNTRIDEIFCINSLNYTLNKELIVPEN